MSIMPYALEWGNDLINLQHPLRKPVVNSSLPFDHWELIYGIKTSHLMLHHVAYYAFLIYSSFSLNFILLCVTNF